MSCGNIWKGFYWLLTKIGDYFQPILLLILRVYWGFGLQAAGLGKFMNHESVAQFFTSLNIPHPELMVYVVAAIEFIGGWCLILGLASRFITIPIIITMVVALITAHAPEASLALTDQAKFVAQAPITYLIVSLVVFAFGPGWFSLDKLFCRTCCKEECSKKEK